MYFYKYQKPGNLEFNMLRRGEIFFASVDELNDASECRPRFILNGTEELWTRLVKLILEGACFHSDFYEQVTGDKIRELLRLTSPLGSILKKHVRNRDLGLEDLEVVFVQVLSTVLEDNALQQHSTSIIDLCRKFIRHEIPRLLNNSSYIAAFSKNAKNPTMWGHYTDAERGFVVVYSTDDDTISVRSPIKILYGVRPVIKDQIGDYEIGIYNEDRLELKTIKYRSKLPKVNAFHQLIPKFSYTEEEDHYDVPLLLGGDAKDKEEDQVGLIKHSNWRYEEEIRAFLPVDGIVPPDVRVLQVSPENIQGIIFGPKMSKDDKQRVILCSHLLRESSLKLERISFPMFSFFQARQRLDRFDYQILPVGILDGPYFGKHLPIKSISNLDETTEQSLHEMSKRIEGEQKSTTNTLNRVNIK
jgi:hypothetical protein